MTGRRRCVASIDQGTQSTRVFLYDETGGVVASHNREFPQHRLRAGSAPLPPLDCNMFSSPPMLAPPKAGLAVSADRTSCARACLDVSQSVPRMHCGSAIATRQHIPWRAARCHHTQHVMPAGLQRCNARVTATDFGLHIYARIEGSLWCMDNIIWACAGGRSMTRWRYGTASWRALRAP